MEFSDDPEREAGIQRRLAEFRAKQQNGPQRGNQFKHWEEWLTTLFSKYVKYGFAEHHRKLWDWIWSIRRGQYIAPLVAVFSRNHGKSTSAELGCVAVGACDWRSYGLYISESQDQADDHVQSVARMLESESIAKYYPQLGKPAIGKYGNQEGWRRNRLRTANGFTVDALGLEKDKRGVKLDEYRPDLLIFDDIDSERDTPATTQKKVDIITKKLIPAGSDDCAIMFIQNLVQRDSTFYRLMKECPEFLTDRIFIGPVPAVEGLEYERRGSKFYITAGKATWEGMDLQKCEFWLNRAGERAFLTEYQHDIKQPPQGAIFPLFSEDLHVITWSMFKQLYKVGHIPFHWKLARGQDWGSTEAHPCVTTWAARASANGPLPGSVFIYRSLMFTGETPKQVAEKIKEVESPLEEWSRMEISKMSHEAKSERDTYRLEHKLFFDPCSPDRNGGIAQIRDYLQPQMTEETEVGEIINILHPFRPAIGRKPNYGRPRLYIIVADDQLDSPIDDRGMLRVRQEFPAYHYLPLASGEPRSQEIPYNLFNDAMDSIRNYAVDFFPSVAPLTPEEEFEQSLPREMRIDKIADMTPEEKASAWMGRHFATHRQGGPQQPQGKRSLLELSRVRRRSLKN